jgi:hypothetical protein
VIGPIAVAIVWAIAGPAGAAAVRPAPEAAPRPAPQPDAATAAQPVAVCPPEPPSPSPCPKLPQEDDVRAPPLPPPPEIPRATPVLSIDDTRTHGPTARNWLDVRVDPQWIASETYENVGAMEEQVAVGLPDFGVRELRDILTPVAPYALRARSQTFVSSSGGWQQGPLTVGLQRYFAIDAIAISPLLFAHLGVEAALSTPWMSGRYAVPPAAVRVVDAVDTELAQNGWSLRPVSAYVRGDFLACRAAYVEAGVTPEAFVPTIGPNEYDLRFRVAAGWSFGCATSVASHRPKISLEYRGRVRLHADSASVAYRDQAGAGVQMDLGPFVIQPLVATEFADKPLDTWILALRLQLGDSKENP